MDGSAVPSATPVRANLAEMLLQLKDCSSSASTTLLFSNQKASDSSPKPETHYEEAARPAPIVYPVVAPEPVQLPDSCNCRKSACLKLYCQCFAASQLCSASCNCLTCSNNSVKNPQRVAAIKGILERNPNAFESKFKPTVVEITDPVTGVRTVVSGSAAAAAAAGPGAKVISTAGASGAGAAAAVHKIGCRCRKSMCLKKYCECFQAAVSCSSSCTCLHCCNTPDMHAKPPGQQLQQIRKQATTGASSSGHGAVQAGANRSSHGHSLRGTRQRGPAGLRASASAAVDQVQDEEQEQYDDTDDDDGNDEDGNSDGSMGGSPGLGDGAGASRSSSGSSSSGYACARYYKNSTGGTNGPPFAPATSTALAAAIINTTHDLKHHMAAVAKAKSTSSSAGGSSGAMDVEGCASSGSGALGAGTGAASEASSDTTALNASSTSSLVVVGSAYGKGIVTNGGNTILRRDDYLERAATDLQSLLHSRRYSPTTHMVNSFGDAVTSPPIVGWTAGGPGSAAAAATATATASGGGSSGADGSAVKAARIVSAEAGSSNHVTGSAEKKAPQSASSSGSGSSSGGSSPTDRPQLQHAIPLHLQLSQLSSSILKPRKNRSKHRSGGSTSSHKRLSIHIASCSGGGGESGSSSTTGSPSDAGSVCSSGGSSPGSASCSSSSSSSPGSDDEEQSLDTSQLHNTSVLSSDGGDREARADGVAGASSSGAVGAAGAGAVNGTDRPPLPPSSLITPHKAAPPAPAPNHAAAGTSSSEGSGFRAASPNSLNVISALSLLVNSRQQRQQSAAAEQGAASSPGPSSGPRKRSFGESSSTRTSLSSSGGSSFTTTEEGDEEDENTAPNGPGVMMRAPSEEALVTAEKAPRPTLVTDGPSPNDIAGLPSLTMKGKRKPAGGGGGSAAMCAVAGAGAGAGVPEVSVRKAGRSKAQCVERPPLLEQKGEDVQRDGSGSGSAMIITE